MSCFLGYLLLTIGICLVLLAIEYTRCYRKSEKIKNSILASFGKIPSENMAPMDSITSYYFFKNANDPKENAIDEMTWNDLNMDSVFSRINACSTSIGEEYLYNLLHEPKFDESQLKQREQLVDHLIRNPKTRQALQTILIKMGKSNHNCLSSFIFQENLPKLKYPLLYKALALIPILSCVLTFLNPTIGAIVLITSFTINLFVYFYNKRFIEVQLASINYFASILASNKAIFKIEDDSFQDLINNAKKPYLIFKPFAGKISSIFKSTSSDLEALLTYVKIIFLTDLRKYNFVMDVIHKNHEDFHQLYESIGWLDTAVSIASYRKSLDYFCLPTFIKEPRLYFENLYHPLITMPVANSITMDKNIIITGSNATGKSTFIKASAVNCILAQTIFTCNAKQFETRPSLVITSMAVKDDLLTGDSYFISEIKSLKRIIEKTNKVYCTCYIDEILKGTNTIERIAASAAVLKYLSKENCLCIVASHDIELTGILSNIYDNYHFSEQITDVGISFDYKLIIGTSKTRNAIKLLDFMAFPSQVVHNSSELAEKFFSSKIWDQL